MLCTVRECFRTSLVQRNGFWSGVSPSFYGVGALDTPCLVVALGTPSKKLRICEKVQCFRHAFVDDSGWRRSFSIPSCCESELVFFS